VVRVLLSRRWLGALAAAAVFAVAAFFLGRWQWHRYEAKSARADLVQSHYSAPARPLESVVTGGPLPLERDWTRVEGSGQYAGGATLLVRNRPWDGIYGYEVLVPLVLADGRTVLVDRGWVPNAARASLAPQVPAAPSGEVTVTGWARQGEPSLGRRLPSGQLASINLREAEREVGLPLLGGYVVLQREATADGTSPQRPRPLERPDTDLGPHQAYAFQWWLAMPLGFVLVFLGVRREAQEGQPITNDQAAGGLVPGAGRTAADKPGRPARPKKVRIWDEEDA
jgi:cytochrome oxidase assembly protein ShyY1